MSFPTLKWFTASLAIGVGFSFGLGVQVGGIPLRAPSSISTASGLADKACTDGRPVVMHSHHLKSVHKNALLDLGGAARQTLKNCLCEGFKGSDCLALKIEISER